MAETATTIESIADETRKALFAKLTGAGILLLAFGAGHFWHLVEFQADNHELIRDLMASCGTN